MRLAKIRARLKDRSKIIEFLDMDIKINVINRNLMENANLAMRRRTKLKLILYISHSQFLFDLCKYIEVAIGRLKIRHLIIVIETRNHDLVLGQPFLNFVKFSREYKPNIIFETISHFHTHQIAFLVPNFLNILKIEDKMISFLSF